MIPLLVSFTALVVAVVVGAVTVHYTRQARRYTEQAIKNYERAARDFDSAARIQTEAATRRSTSKGNTT